MGSVYLHCRRAWVGLSLFIICFALVGTSRLQGQSNSSVTAFGAVPDGILRTDGAMTAGSAAFTSPSSSFTAADVGKYIQIIGAGTGSTSHTDGAMSAGSSVLTSASGTFCSADVGRGIVVIGAGPGGGNLVTTIQGYNSGDSVTLGVAASGSVAGATYYYGAMTLEATIQGVQNGTTITLSAPALATISGATFAYGTDNHAAFQAALDAAGQAGGGVVSAPAPSSCPSGATCGYVLKVVDQMTDKAPGAIKIRYNNVSLSGSEPQTNLFCRGAFASYTNTPAFSGVAANIRGVCVAIGDNTGPNGGAGTAVSNVTISNLHLYGMTNGNTFNSNYGYPPQTPTGDGWDITHKAIYMWDNSAFSNITINSVIIEGFKGENIYSGGSVLTGMVIENCTITNFDSDGISMLAADLQVLNNTISNGSNTGVENSTVSSGGSALVRQLYQGNTISRMAKEGIVVVGVDGGVASGSVQITNNTFDTIGQINGSGMQAAISIGYQGSYLPPANVTVTGNTCHDCYSFGVFETSGNSVVQGNTFTVDRYRAGSVFPFMYALSGLTIANNTGSATSYAQANGLSLGAVYMINPGYASGAFAWKNVVLKGNSWTFAAPQYEFGTTSGLGWQLVSADNLNWQGDVCTGCTHSDVNHGVVNLGQTTTIEPYGPVVYVMGNNSSVTATVNAQKQEDGSQIQIVNTGSNAVSFVSDANMSLPSTITVPGGSNSSVSFFYHASAGKWTTTSGTTATTTISASGGTPQSATVNTTFGSTLQATVMGSGNTPMSGVSVTFTAPSSGAIASFGGAASATAVTGANGVATSPVPTANGQAGSYLVTASAAGVGSATFSLTNTGSITGSGGLLSGSGTSSAAAVNLTAEGGLDWVHWGDGSLNRKAGVTAQISSDSVIGTGNVPTYSNDPRPLSWTDGTPTAISSNNMNGIYINGAGQGFSFTAPADTTTRTLVVHVGGWYSGATLTAHLSDGSASDFVDVTTAATGQYDRNYTLSYSAGAAGQTLKVSWVMSCGNGNVTLNAAALAGASVAATAGTPQSAAVGTAFPTALQATVMDGGGNPVSGAAVTFTAPGSGPTANFAGSTSATATTNSSGIATAPTLTAGTQTGGYQVIATVAGFAGSASFGLTNLAGSPSSIAATAGTPQSTNVNAVFATALQATVKDASGNPLGGITVTFAAPTSGASASFGGSATVTTNAGGIATAPAITANGQAGSYTVTASVAGVTTAASFSLANLAGTPASIAATGGTPQSAKVSTAFATALQATVKDASGNPLSGVTVTFAAPTSGASATFGGSATVTTNASGVATAPGLTANGQAGSYTITAAVSGVSSPASFSLTNLAGTPASVTATAGTPQSATVSTAFATALQATVKDASGNPLSGVTVTFATPTSGASATLGGSATVATNASGLATAPALTANGQAGSYTITASVSGVTTPASFSLTNTAATTGGGTLSGSGNSNSGTFNLTTEGVTDWVNWGVISGGPGLADRKRGVTAQISNYKEIGSMVVGITGNDARTLTWSDGAPNASGSNSTVVYVDSNSGHAGNGFSFTVPADTTLRTLVVHAGGQSSGGAFTATLSDGSAATYQDTTPNLSGRYDRNYTITYSAASAGQSLTIQWVDATASGHVSLGGAALQ